MNKSDVLEQKARLLRVSIEGLLRISQSGLGVDDGGVPGGDRARI